MHKINQKIVFSNSIEAKGIPEIELYFPKFSKQKEIELSEKEKCILCTGCCNYITVPIDPPTEENLDLYTWYLYHKNIEIYLDHEEQWQLLIKTPCKHLLPNGHCNIYSHRPNICKEYDPKNCSRTGKDYQILITNANQLLRYIKKNKKEHS
ncbi:MAG: YkgJ family cysteine cluster protein [Leptonema sp. (in: bacteria)]